MNSVQQGDFTKLAKDYIHRTGYSLSALRMLAAYVGASRSGFKVADVGAGTGKLTENLQSLGFSGFAVEPNDAMRAEGKGHVGEKNFIWSKGSGEETGLPDHCVDWVFMASSFHWTDAPRALKEFHRILKKGGHFTALWNPRDLEKNLLQKKIDENIRSMVPGMQRVSSGSKQYTEGLTEKLLAGGLFNDLVFVEAPHVEMMTHDRYMGAWKSVNDIQAQAGDAKFAEILKMIEGEIKSMDKIPVSYTTRAWTVQAVHN